MENDETKKEESPKKEEGFWDKMKEKASDAWEAAKEGADKLSDKAEDAMEKVEEKAEKLWDKTKDKVEDIAEDLTGKKDKPADIPKTENPEEKPQQ